METRDLVFRAGDGTALVGWYATPAARGPHPLVVLTHGLSGLVDLGLAAYAQHFAGAGFACLAYDHRNWGRSGGWPRCESDPWQQVADLRDAISFARTLPDVDGDRIGLWGTSYAGGHVLTVGALDRRVRCIVSQVPLTHGRRSFDAWVPADKRARTLERLTADRDARARGATPQTTPAALPGSDTEEWVRRVDPEGVYRNELTLRSLELLRTYEPGSFVEEIAPTPLLMVVAEHDTQTPIAWQLESFERAGEPKRLVEIDCRHYDVYTDRFKEAVEAAADWFVEHLLPEERG